MHVKASSRGDGLPQLFVLVMVVVLSTTALIGAPNRPNYIVSFVRDTPARTRGAVVEQLGGTIHRHYPHMSASSVFLPNEALVRMLERHPLVVAVEPNYPVVPVPIDEIVLQGGRKPPRGGGGDDSGGSNQIVPSGIYRIGAGSGNLPGLEGSGIRVAIMDTGIDRTHPDLAGTFFAAECFTTDATAYCDHDVATGGHGTQVTGVIGAQDNTIDLVGIAPRAIFHDVRIFPDTTSNTNDVADVDKIIQAFNWILSYRTYPYFPKIHVINMSFRVNASQQNVQILHSIIQTVDSEGILMVAAAGNLATSEVSTIVPAGFPEVIAVSSTTAQEGAVDSYCASGFGSMIPPDTASSFTADGAFDPVSFMGVVISAPGSHNETVVRKGSSCTYQLGGLPLLKPGGGIVTGSGTSLSAPHVTGVIALMLRQAVDLRQPLPRRNEVVQRLRTGASRIGDAPLDSLHPDYTFDGEREGILWAPGALSSP